MPTFDTLLQALKRNSIPFSEDRIKRAFELADNAHKGQTRASGEPYITHPLSVAIILTDIDCDEAMIISALLHDTVEDTSTTFEEIEQIFGQEISGLVAGLTKISKVEMLELDKNVVNIRKMFLAMSKDIRVIFVKLADRLHNMQTLATLPERKQQRIARETLTIYAPIATRLGVYFFKNRLEDLCFRFLYPKEYMSIGKDLETYHHYGEHIAERAIKSLETTLIRDHIPFTSITWRKKENFSVFRKMQKRKEKDLHNIYDIFAVRVITDNIEHCYQILGIIHQHWKPLSNRFKDYIAVPKSNGYKSLHTTVFGLAESGKNFLPMEIQIRTESMHEEAEKGNAAHWKYKGADEKNRGWIQSLVTLADEIQNSSEDFLKGIHQDVLNYRIFVITPKGDVKDLPAGATPIDFAYAIHSDIGNHLEFAKVNGHIVPLNSELKNGDIVEVKTNKNRVPNTAWVGAVKTTQAKQGIKQWLKNQSVENILKFGREEINKFLQKLGKESLDKEYSLLKIYKDKELSLKERENLIMQVGDGSRKASEVIRSIFQTTPAPSKKTVSSADTNTLTTDILVLGEKNLETRIAACCNPTPPDKITGFITRGGYVSVHNIHCNFVKKTTDDRFVECRWANEEIPFEVEFTFEVQNIVGIWAGILNFIADNKINLLDFHGTTNKARNTATTKLLVEVTDLDKIPWMVEYFENMTGVVSVDYIVKNPRDAQKI